jgi:predicted Ser/Thr protein kinase
MTNCSQCHTDIPDGMHVCTQCGFRAGSSEPTLVLEGEGEGEHAGPQESLLDLVRRELSRDYEVDVELARGGMAVVFRATEIELSRQVALKVLPPEMALSQSMANRFKREARMAASLEHPNIIPIYRVGQAGRLFFITMKYIDGRALSSLIESQGPLAWPVVWHVLRGCASALAHAHDGGIIHRDIKGANILIDTEGHVIVSDFGVARALEDASMTASGSVIGTPHFMSPEQCAGKRVAAQSDQYSLGVLGFQMLAGHIPYDAETIAAVMHHHFFTPIPPLGSARPDAPQALVDVVSRALAKNPKQRFGTTYEMLAAIEAVPMTDADRRWGEAMLRELASGVPIPRVAAGDLPPLPEVMQLSGPVSTQQPVFTPSEGFVDPSAEGATAAAIARRRTKRTLIASGVGFAGIVATMALWVVSQSAASAGTANGDGAPLAPDGSRLAIADSGAPPAPPRPAVGVVRVRDLPAGAIVSVGGTRIMGGVGEVAPGTHAWRIQAPDHYPDSGTVVVTAGDTLVMEGRLAEVPKGPPPTGKLRVSAFPRNALIVVDDRTLGAGVVMDSVLAVGAHRLRVSAPGFVPFDTTITIEEGVTTPVPSIKLQEAGGPP